VDVYQQLTAAGEEFGSVNPGYYAINALRLEKGYRAFGSDLTPETNPVEAGLLFACKLKSDVDFLGRPAVEKARQDGVSRKLASLVLDDPEVMMWGGELIVRDGIAVGQISSAAWAEILGACAALGYVNAVDATPLTTEWLKQGRYEVNVGGQLATAQLHLRPPFDPTGSRIKV
jgi:4-methylaminobutanoate oxidase (formaldehyde-forming)